MTSYNNFEFTNESSGDSVSNPNTFLNPANAFDDSDATTSTLSFTSTGDDDKTIGTTFSSKSLDVAYIKASTDLGSTGTYVNKIILQKYNGSDWIDFMLLSETITQTNSFVGLVSNIGSCSGLRVKFETESSSGNSVSLVINDITYAQSYTYTPRLLLEELGGTNLEDLGDKTAIAEDHTATWKTLLSASIGSAQNAYQILQANNVFDNKDFLMADEFTDSTGTNNTVNTGSTTAAYETDKYILDFTDEASGDTTDIYTEREAWVDVENAFGGTTGFANNFVSNLISDTTIKHALGKIFSSPRYISFVRVSSSATHSLNDPYSIILQSYNGSTWDTVSVLASSNNSGTIYGNKTYFLNDTVQGLRVYFEYQNTTNNRTFNSKLYYLEYGDFNTSSSVIIDSNTLTLDDTENAITIYTDCTHTANTSIGIKVGDGSTKTIEYTMTNNKVIVPMSDLSSGVSEIEFILRTTNTSETPELKGYGCLLLK